MYKCIYAISNPMYLIYYNFSNSQKKHMNQIIVTKCDDCSSESSCKKNKI